jgi:holo-[acyl-carrier protein] synthase
MTFTPSITSTRAWPRLGVIAVGIDLVSLSQIRQSHSTFGDRYLHRVFTHDELAYSMTKIDPTPHLAARFAAKEAAIKALRVEDVQVPWTSMEVCGEDAGSRQMCLGGAARALANKRGIARLAVSLSQEGDMAMAVVLAIAKQ